MSEKRDWKTGVIGMTDKPEVSYSCVHVVFVCHKCGKGIKIDSTKTKCEHCNHTLGMMPRQIGNSFSVIV